jgi:hypothetical protein
LEVAKAVGLALQNFHFGVKPFGVSIVRVNLHMAAVSVDHEARAGTKDRPKPFLPTTPQSFA